MKKLTVAEFLDSLSITSASNTWKLLVKEGFDTIEKINSMSMSEIAEAGASRNKRVGDKRAEKIYMSLHSERVQEMLKYSEGMIKEEDEINIVNLKMDLSGKSVVVTGAGPLPRKELKEILENVGANVQGGVSKNTDYLIMADPDSQTGKARKARDLGVITLGYDEVF